VQEGKNHRLGYNQGRQIIKIISSIIISTAFHMYIYCIL